MGALPKKSKIKDRRWIGLFKTISDQQMFERNYIKQLFVNPLIKQRRVKIFYASNLGKFQVWKFLRSIAFCNGRIHLGHPRGFF